MNKPYKNADAAWDAGLDWIEETTKWEKLEYLRETCTSGFLNDHLVNELLKFMNEFEFNEFFKHLQRNWAIKTAPELDYEMNS
jgi:hypothetical protein